MNDDTAHSESIASEADHKPTHPAVFGKNPLLTPSPARQSWGTVIAIVVIVAMVVIGAFYAWQKRAAEQAQYPTGVTE